MSRALACPSCGAAKSLHNPGLVMFVCEYCAAVVYWDEQNVRAAGERSLLTEGFSRLYRDATGSYHRRRFRVLGRVRYSFGSGVWDEWFLELEGDKTVWITEDQHELALQKGVAMERPSPFEHYRPGGRIELEGVSFAVQEVGEAECVGVEGALPKHIELGETYPYVDATSLDGQYSLGLEFDDEKPSAYLGRWLKYAELVLDDEGQEW